MAKSDFSVNLKTALDLKKFFREVQRADRSALKKIGQVVAKAEKDEIKRGGTSAPGDVPRSKTGNLRKSIGYELKSASVLVGAKRSGKEGGKGFHAHLVKWGTKERKTKSGKSTGAAAPRHFPGAGLEKIKTGLAQSWSGTF